MRRPGGGGSILAPLPTLGYAARECYLGTFQYGYSDASENSEAHFLLKSAIAKHQANEMLSQEEEDAYALWIAGIDGEAVESCVNHLSCNSNPGSCDIDPGVIGSQSCTVASATSVCTSHVAGILEAQLELPNPDKYPECSGTTYYNSLDVYCEGHIPEMNATGETGGGASCIADGVIPGTGSTGADSTGADSTGADSTGAGAAPFGDLGDLIACDGTSCHIDAQLLLNLTESFNVFYDVGVRLEGVDGSTQCGPGVVVSGLSMGTAPADLADEFSVENGDLVTAVNGIALSSEAGFVEVLEEIAEETEFEVVVKRRNGSGCSTTTWTLTIVP